MKKSEILQDLIKDHPEIRSEDVRRSLDIFFEEIARYMANGDRVELRGFGAFSTRQRRPRKARNPRSGQSVSVPEKRAAHFRPGKEMRERLNTH